MSDEAHREGPLIKSLQEIKAADRVRWLSAALTLESRRIFHECLTTPNEETRKKLDAMKSTYWTLVSEVMTLVLDEAVTEANIFPYSYIVGFFGVMEKFLDEQTYRNVLALPVDPHEVTGNRHIVTLEGMLSYFILGDRSMFLYRTADSFELIKELVKEGKIQYVFGNVSNGNFDAALITQVCGLPQDHYRLYQYSRKAMLEYGSPGFSLLDSELGAVNKNASICIVDGFCGSGESIEESILGFRNRGFEGPLHVYISKGCFPAIRKAQTEMLLPTTRFIPGNLSPSPMILRAL